MIENLGSEVGQGLCMSVHLLNLFLPFTLFLLYSGQFWNVETNVTKYTKPLRDGIVENNTYLVELMPENKPNRRFIGFLEERTWNLEKSPCIYAGNSQGGPIYEVADGEPNDSVIEGAIEDYSTKNFTYDHFDKRRCR